MKSIKIIAATVLFVFLLSTNAQSIMCKLTGDRQIPSRVQAVDLGLPSGIKWANMNIGAESPEDYGDYFAWGETTGYKDGKEAFSKETYKCDMTTKTPLDPKDDAATANWGGSWRMPTKAEQDELRTNCTWVWTKLKRVRGYKVTGPNGNYIFLPAAGYRDESGLVFAGSYGNYWSSSLVADDTSGAYYLYFDSSGDIGWYQYVRYIGYTVRAVCP